MVATAANFCCAMLAMCARFNVPLFEKSMCNLVAMFVDTAQCLAEWLLFAAPLIPTSAVLESVLVLCQFTSFWTNRTPKDGRPKKRIECFTTKFPKCLPVVMLANPAM